LYFRQLLAGRDFARDDPVARQMVNFAYLIGDRETGDALAVDPAYNVRELVETAAADGMRITGALVTHYHPDHVGGDLMGYSIEGARELLAMDDVAAPLHVQRAEAPGVKRVTGASDSDLVVHDSGDEVRAGDSLGVVHCRSESQFESIREFSTSFFHVGSSRPVENVPLIREIVS